ncbi:Hypothetical protein CINCED_3A009697 [Cinara cedri]|uniref:Uncharacterized protein n=1 Tax=Cinara cedri TaxID=506608 RepID=A0A5E4N832_9HEMI|nr:Hypothetical protein CINCED_3A009697 [Cinara cedri]
MTVRFSSIPTVVVLFNAVFDCQTPPWTLKRVDPGSSAMSFFNNTVVDSFTLTRWMWTDSSGGFWDTRLKVTSLNKDAPANRVNIIAVLLTILEICLILYETRLQHLPFLCDNIQAAHHNDIIHGSQHQQNVFK